MQANMLSLSNGRCLAPGTHLRGLAVDCVMERTDCDSCSHGFLLLRWYGSKDVLRTQKGRGRFETRKLPSSGMKLKARELRVQRFASLTP